VLEEVEGGFGAEFEVVGAFLAAEVLFVAVEFPAGDVLGEETGVAEFGQFGDDLFVGMAVVEHGVDEVADGAREGGDFAGETTRGNAEWRVVERLSVGSVGAAANLGVVVLGFVFWLIRQLTNKIVIINHHSGGRNSMGGGGCRRAVSALPKKVDLSALSPMPNFVDLPKGVGMEVEQEKTELNGEELSVLLSRCWTKDSCGLICFHETKWAARLRI